MKTPIEIHFYNKNNEVIKTYREKGFFVTYNHPVWSQENYSVYSQYKGMNAMEIFNWAGFRAGYDEVAPTAYDDLLRLGGCTRGSSIV